MEAFSLDDVLLLNDSVTINNSTLSNQTTEFNISTDVTSGYRMFVMPTLPGWVSTMYLVLLCLTIAFGIPGNFITALAYFCIKRKTSCDWYIFFVAVFDLISCTFRVTGYLLEFLDLWVKMTNTAYCLFVAWVSQTSVCVSMFIFGLISVERYIKICCVTSLNMTAERSRNICLMMAALTFVLGFPTVLMFENTPNGVCSVSASVIKEPWVKAYYCIIIALFITLTFAVMVCYMAIIWTVRKRRKTVGVFPEQNTRIPTNQTSDQSPPGKSHPKNHPTDTSLSEGNSCSYLSVPLQCPGGAVSPRNHRRSAPKIFIVPGPRTQVILQPGATETTSQLDGEDVEAEVKEETASQHIKYSAQIKRTKIIHNLSSPPTSSYIATDSNLVTGNVNLFSQHQYARRQRRDYKITGLLFLVTTIFILSWIPPYYATVKAFFIGYTFPMSTTEFVTLKLAPTSFIINNFSNPIIYLALSSTYRQKVKHLLTSFLRFMKKPCM